MADVIPENHLRLAPPGVEGRFTTALALMGQAAELAMVMRPAPGAPQAAMKGQQDYVTAADKAVEKLLREGLLAAFPGDAFLGEETGGARRPEGWRWIADPIDGTSNYARGRDRWCVSLGLFWNDTPMMGIISAPTTLKTYAAIKGCGAWRNGQPMKAATTKSTSHAMVEVGWSPWVEKGWYEARMVNVLSTGAMPRTLGSGALALADVACGRQDGYLEKVIQLWDVAAALVLLEEAGASVTPFLQQGGLEGGAQIFAASPALAAPLAAALGLVGQTTTP
ncbi:inositol monophosphatase [Formicincola oecophyllae]|uniref:Inositol monophosphatase n=1 Tax=Formicincola oecophyllae TaxID=2558361 RepID=A0A4Y6U922_9PROT|nr:inositol monophosphatase [Formicincola oecophyllae]QDH12881.1 inositol monophosphatase [Formicincola oecophyllae]